MTVAFVIVLVSSYADQPTLLPTQASHTIKFNLDSSGLMGLRFEQYNPLDIDFIVDRGQASLSKDKMTTEVNRLIKYFLAALTIPEKDLWVNLSPYEKEKIVPEMFGLTEMGRDLLVQDHLLKKKMAFLFHPSKGVGATFWDKVYAKAYDLYGTKDVTIDTFNKVWIVPEKAVVYEETNNDACTDNKKNCSRIYGAYVVESRLKVLLEEDYLARSRNAKNNVQEENIGAQVMRDVLIPVLEEEVNHGEAFSSLRQAYHSLILAMWYKDNVQRDVFPTSYIGHQKVVGIDIKNQNEKQDIWNEYVVSYQQGEVNEIRQEEDLVQKDGVLRQYFSGGVGLYQARNVYRVIRGAGNMPNVNLDQAMIVGTSMEVLSSEDVIVFYRTLLSDNFLDALVNALANVVRWVHEEKFDDVLVSGGSAPFTQVIFLQMWQQLYPDEAPPSFHRLSSETNDILYRANVEGRGDPTIDDKRQAVEDDLGVETLAALRGKTKILFLDELVDTGTKFKHIEPFFSQSAIFQQVHYAFFFSNINRLFDDRPRVKIGLFDRANPDTMLQISKLFSAQEKSADGLAAQHVDVPIQEVLDVIKEKIRQYSALSKDAPYAVTALVRNSQEETYDEVMARLLGNVDALDGYIPDARTWQAVFDVEQAMADELAAMTNVEMGEALRDDLIPLMEESSLKRGLLDRSADPGDVLLRDYLDLISSSQGVVAYKEELLRNVRLIREALAVIYKKRNEDAESERDMLRRLYRYRLWMREVARRWSADGAMLIEQNNAELVTPGGVDFGRHQEINDPIVNEDSWYLAQPKEDSGDMLGLAPGIVSIHLMDETLQHFFTVR